MISVILCIMTIKDYYFWKVQLFIKKTKNWLIEILKKIKEDDV